MSEIERAIETLEKQDFSFLHVRLKDGEVYPLDDAVKTALTLCRAELEREKNPLTWNERINQMTVEEKATLFQHDDCFIYKLTGTAYCDRHLGCEECTKQFLNSPYTEGATK